MGSSAVCMSRPVVTRAPERMRPTQLADQCVSSTRSSSSVHVGARQLVDDILDSTRSPLTEDLCAVHERVWMKRPTEIGLPFPHPMKCVSPRAGRRLVCLSEGMPPVLVAAETRRCFIRVTMRAPAPLPEAKVCRDEAHPIYGTVLGYSDDDEALIWHERAKPYASVLPISCLSSVCRADVLQCPHCSGFLLRYELTAHLDTHKKGAGDILFIDDPVYGTACGDTSLLLHLSSGTLLAAGSQGVVELLQLPPITEVDCETCRGSSTALRHATGPAEVAVKTMRFATEAAAQGEYSRAVRRMMMAKSEYLVEYLTVQIPPDHLTVRLIMPYYREGTVGQLIRRCRGGSLEEIFLLSLASQLAQALALLHQQNPPVVHGDLTPDNVMLCNGGEQVVLMDLEASCELESICGVETMQLGTAAYMAPETLHYGHVMFASDMWSLGVLLYVLTVLPPFPMITNPHTMEPSMLNTTHWATQEDVDAIKQYCGLSDASVEGVADCTVTPPSSLSLSLCECVTHCITSKGFSSTLAKLISDLLVYDPRRRPSATEVSDRLALAMDSFTPPSS